MVMAARGPTKNYVWVKQWAFARWVQNRYVDGKALLIYVTNYVSRLTYRKWKVYDTVLVLLCTEHMKGSEA